jgi:N-acetylglucosamine repressor
MKKATRQQTKEHNRKLVLQKIFEHEAISRAEIARITSLTRTTVSEIVNALLSEGLVSEVGIGESQGGKNPILLSLEEDSRHLIGLDLAHSEFRGAIVNLRGKIRTKITQPVNDRCGEDAVQLVFQILDQLIAASDRPLVGIGVGTPGLVNTNTGLVLNAVNLDWHDLPLSRMLVDRYHLPVYILNDSQAAALGEFTYGGEHKVEQNLVVINARHGLGAGIIINGKLFPGDGGGAGEIGHIVVVQKDGLPCRCGNHGCLETVASAQALVQQVQKLVKETNSPLSPWFPQGIDLDAINKAFTAGVPQIQELVIGTARYMGFAISSLVGTLNIQMIVLMGDMTYFGEPWLNVIRETIIRNTLSRLAEGTQVEIGQLGKDGIVLGASAALANDYSHLFIRQRMTD